MKKKRYRNLTLPSQSKGTKENIADGRYGTIQESFGYLDNSGKFGFLKITGFRKLRYLISFALSFKEIYKLAHQIQR